MKSNHLNTPIKPWETTTLNDAVLEWIINLWEVMWDIKDRINNAQITMLQASSEEYKKAIKTVTRINTRAGNAEQKKFETQDWFLTRTARLRLDFDWEPKILYSNWKGYLVIDKENVYEEIEQMWNSVIVYNPINKQYSAYDLLWNKMIFSWDDEITTTCVENCFISWRYIITYFNNHEEIISLWKDKIIWNIEKHWNIIFVRISSGNQEKVAIIWKNYKEIDWSEISKMRTKKWKNLLFISWNLGYTLYDCDWDFSLIKNAYQVSFAEIIWLNDWVEEIWNKITYKMQPTSKKIKELHIS